MSKILVIDDEETIVKVLSMTLRLDGHTVLTATSGEEGLDIFLNDNPEIVLTDIKMPGVDGLEVLRRIKEQSEETEVVIMTGHGDIDNAIEALKYGASDFLNKPIKDEALTVALKRADEKLNIKRKLKQYTDNLENQIRVATQELRRQSNFMARLIQSSNDGIVATDSSLMIVIFNPAAERIFGYSYKEILYRKRAMDLFPTDVVAFLEQDLSHKSRSGQLPWNETVIHSKSGEAIPVRFTGTLLHEYGDVMGSVAFFQDLREIKRLEKELVKSERLAAIGQTTASLAHCIKNILHGFKGGKYLVEVGIQKNNPEKLKAGWEMVKRNINRTSDLALDLLSYSKEREPEFEECDPNEIANEVCEVVLETAKENQVEIIKDFDPNIGQVLLDPMSVYRALLNLMTNAVDACILDENRDKHFQVRLQTVREAGNTIRFEVSDNGMGMPEKVREKLFTSFFSTKGHKGTGLGLLVVRKLVEEHGGTIEVDSEEGKGTTFRIRLPYKCPEDNIHCDANESL